MELEIVFDSERINFVKVSESLIPDYLEMVNDIEVQKFISHNRNAYTFDDETKWVKSKLEEKDHVYSMIEKDTNEFIGNIEIMNIKDNIGEMGIAITRKKQDNHFGQEAIKRLIEYAFNDLKLDALELNVYDFNPRGIKCYQNVGFVKDGPGKNHEDIHMIIRKQS